MHRSLAAVLCAVLVVPLAACDADAPLDGEDAPFPDGKADGGLEEGSPEARGVLALVNDPAVDADVLDGEGGLNRTAAVRIMEHRAGPDGAPGTDDDEEFDTLAELDAVPFVGPIALARLVELARARGLVDDAAPASVVFSPRPREASHLAGVEALIAGAERSIDVAMYSFSDAGISAALADAVDRGVAVRFVFETARADNRLADAARAASKSGRLERAGVDVRFVNKTMHHKFVIVDGPRDDVETAATARLALGSANWSSSGASVYDENTLFFTGQPELAVAMQREFDLMWEHSRDLVVDAPKPFVASTADLDGAAVPDSPDLAFFSTSANFTIADGSTTFRTDRGRLTVSDQFVAAIERADTSILLASGHLRLRPVAEALLAARARDPELDIRVYLDQQEFLSLAGERAQEQAVEACLVEAAGDPDDEFACLNRSRLFGKQVGDGGVDVRYKTYAYRWDHAYAVQMHHKYMIVDGDELLTGSYNLSINAEHDTFDDTLHLRGPAFAPIIAAYEANFEAIWQAGGDGALEALREEIATADPVPLVFGSIALGWQENTDLKALLREHCAEIDSEAFRDEPAAHRVCPR